MNEDEEMLKVCADLRSVARDLLTKGDATCPGAARTTFYLWAAECDRVASGIVFAVECDLLRPPKGNLGMAQRARETLAMASQAQVFAEAAAKLMKGVTGK